MGVAEPAVAPTGERSGWASRDLLLKLTGTLLFLFLVGFVASLGTPVSDRDSAGNEVFHFGWMSLVPAAVAIVLAFWTRQVLVALFLGIVTGGVVYAFGAGVPVWDVADFPWRRANIVETFFLAQIGTRNYAIILFVYLWSLGGLIGLWGRTGGALHFAEWVGRNLVVGPRSAMFFGWLLGIIFHQGGTISTVLAGTTARPLFDRHRVSKEEAAYIVDSTASPVATILPFNAFPLVAAGVVAGSIPYFRTVDGAADFDKAVNFFFLSIPFNFYAIFAVLATLLFSLRLIPGFGPMRKARRRVDETGEIVRPGSEPLQSKELSDVEVHPGYRTGLSDFFIPLAFLLTIAIGPYLIRLALGLEPTVYVVEAFFLALVSALLVALVKGMPLRVAVNGIVDGAKGVTMAAIVLALAVTIKGVADALGTGYFVASVLSGLDAALLPLLLLIAAMVVAFSTGTSFGTFAVIFPVAMPLADALMPNDPLFLSLSFGAVVSGSVFGDQASPISDTTILSSLAVGCDLMDHVTTQIPYALVAAGLAGVLYLLLGFALF